MTRRRFSAAPLLASLGLALSPPVFAKLGEPPVLPRAGETAGMPDADYRALVERSLGFVQADDCAGLLGLLDPAVPRTGGRQRVFIQLLRIPCLGGAGRGAEVKSAYEELDHIDPTNGAVRRVGVVIATLDRDYVRAGERLAILAEQNPEELSGVSADIERGIVQELTQANQFALRDRLFIALATADWQPEDRPDLRDSLAVGAIEALLDAGRVEDARALLSRVTMPELLATMATERHYEPLWPAIEARLGDNAGRAVDRFAASRLAAFGTRPEDERVVRDAARAFILLGRYPEAAEVAAHVPVREGMGEDAVSVQLYRADALAAAGDRAGAIAVLRPFTALDLERTPDAVSALVRLAEMLDESGQADEALTVSRALLARGDAALSPWGQSWIKRTEICALGTLGRSQEASRLADSLASRSGDNEAATIEALLCLGRSDEAARLAVAVLGTSEGAGRLADQFQPDDALWAPTPSRLRALWATFLERPDVRRAFDRSARILPRNLWPARTPRPIPRFAPSDDSPPTT